MAALLSSHIHTRSSRCSSIILLTWGSDSFYSIPEESPKHHWVPWAQNISLLLKISPCAVRCATGQDKRPDKNWEGKASGPSKSVIKSTLCLKPGISLNMCVGLGHSDLIHDNPWLDPPFTIWAQSLWVCTMVSVPGWLIWLLDSCVKTTGH